MNKDYWTEDNGLNRRSLSAMTFLTVLIVFSAWDGLHHYILFPLYRPRFDGVIVYVDNLHHSEISGVILLVTTTGPRNGVEFSGSTHERFMFELPQGTERLNLVIMIPHLFTRVNVRVVDGLTGELIEAKDNSVVVQGEIHYREVLFLSTSYERNPARANLRNGIGG